MYLWHLTMYLYHTVLSPVNYLAMNQKIQETRLKSVKYHEINSCMVYRNVNNRQQNKTIEWDCHLLSIIIRWNASYATFLTLPLMVSSIFSFTTQSQDVCSYYQRFLPICFLGSVKKTILSKAKKKKLLSLTLKHPLSFIHTEFKQSSIRLFLALTVQPGILTKSEAPMTSECG